MIPSIFACKTPVFSVTIAIYASGNIRYLIRKPKQEAHGPRPLPEKAVQINKHV